MFYVDLFKDELFPVQFQWDLLSAHNFSLNLNSSNILFLIYQTFYTDRFATPWDWLEYVGVHSCFSFILLINNLIYLVVCLPALSR